MNQVQQGTRRAASAVAAILAALSVASCGGGDPYTGLWQGTVDGNRAASAIVLGDGTYYLKYAPSASSPGGLVRGTGEFRGATFTSTDGIDFRFAYPPQAPATARITGKLGGHQTVSGKINAAPFSLTYVKPFDPDARLADLAGSYPGEVTFSLGLRQTTFDVTADGKLSTVLNGCTITGQVVPRNDDAFDLTIQFAGSPCVFPGAVFRGAALYSHDLQQLDAAVVNASFGQAITFTASRKQP
ncbi:hypothetical protein H8N03_16645 [Ramlibacter sp. USB13]|uniref:YceI family protein n=1 Tax=Ramlibacter cellulosilyticus TaxID=2764187 RepID=A0A923MUT8_9BURK|nr:hypothetical protein [Ramlibacter cellulosilyticus]MBC5784579.1 hypothetical protein [Ramlibacter cellulosilyticus]